MNQLIAELEAAPVGSRELDAKIWNAIYPHAAVKVLLVDHPLFSTSLDAKLPWENIEEVGLFDIVPGEPLGEVWEAWHRYPPTDDSTVGDRIMGAGHTEALARRVAALKAHQAMEEAA